MSQSNQFDEKSANKLRRASNVFGITSVVLIVVALLAQLLKGKIEIDVITLEDPAQAAPIWHSIDTILGWIVATLWLVPVTAFIAVVTGMIARAGRPTEGVADAHPADRSPTPIRAANPASNRVGLYVGGCILALIIVILVLGYLLQGVH
jgi:hypothetical protein